MRYKNSQGEYIGINAVGDPNTTEVITEAVNDWLDNHSSTTTVVEDHSLGVEKMVLGTLGYYTPQMYGAAGDGTRGNWK